MTASVDLTQFRVTLGTRTSAESIPAIKLLLNEDRSGGWSGTVQVNPRRAAADDALQTLLRDGLTPGSAMTARLVIAGNTGYTGTAVRTWPSVITSVNSTGSSDVGEPDALCVVTFRDLVSYLRNRPVWAAFVDTSFADMLGGVLSAAGGGDGRPTSNPVLPGMPVVRIEEELRTGIDEIPYAIAAGEPLGYWLNRICGRLGVRLEARADVGGSVRISVCDRAPAESDLNRDGGIDMTLDPDRDPSATNLVLSGLDVNAASTPRGGMLDNLSGGGAARFGPEGPVESVLTGSETNLDEAERRAGFRQTNQRLSQARITVTSCQPGMLPGRVVNLGDDDSDTTAAGDTDTTDSDGGDGEPDGFDSVLGARRWQVADVAHLCVQGRYWNQASLQKTGLAWRPAMPDEIGAPIVSGVVDDGTSAAGDIIERDRMGRIPVRFPFVPAPATDADGAASPAPSGPRSWPPVVPLAPVAPGAGNLHGFVSDHRQGDWCRVAVLHPLYAEIIGFSHRDDRFLSARVRDATVGIVVREGERGRPEWRGILFRPDEDLDEELEPDA